MELYIRIMNALSNLRDSEDGVTAIEYGLIAAGIAVVIIGAVGLTGDALNTTFTDISGAVN